jgi:hypothetical protein
MLQRAGLSTEQLRTMVSDALRIPQIRGYHNSCRYVETVNKGMWITVLTGALGQWHLAGLQR